MATTRMARSTFPLTYIGSDNVNGGFIACTALADALPEGSKIYVTNTRPGISTTDQREEGCLLAAEARRTSGSACRLQREQR